MLSSLSLDPTMPTIVFAAKLQAWKRPVDLLSAVERMKVQANLLILGDGPLRPEIEKRARSLPSARALGFVNQLEIGRWYGVGDVFVLPSEREPWGLVVNEAMAAGAVPIVTDVVGCAPDLVTSGSGRTVAVGDVGALAAACDEVLCNPTLLAQMRRRGAELISRYSIEATANGIEYGTLIATGHERLSA